MNTTDTHRTVDVHIEVDDTAAMRELDELAELVGAAQLERYRTIIIALEAELADTTDKAMLAEYLHTEVVELRAQVAELLKLNAEGRPWQITPDGATVEGEPATPYRWRDLADENVIATPDPASGTSWRG